MYTTLDFLVVLNARRFIVGASPELKFRTTDEADTAHVVSDLPTAHKPWYTFSLNFVQIRPPQALMQMAATKFLLPGSVLERRWRHMRH